MCIIIYTPNGYIPKKQLKNSLAFNNDGWGVMWPEKGTLQICTGMAPQAFFKEWKWIGKLQVPKVFHARIGTHGTKDMDNCHPFAIPGHGQLAVAHNGIISSQAFNPSDKSDTWHFVNNILAKLPVGFLAYDGILDMIADYIGHSKLAFMDGEGNTHLINAKLGFWEDKRWYSNRSCDGWRTSTTYDSNITRYYGGHGYAEAALGFSRVVDEKKPVQENFPVFKEDEVALAESYRAHGADQHSTYDAYDKADDKEWQAMVQACLDASERIAQAGSYPTNGCGIGLPAAVMGAGKSSDDKTGTATLEDFQDGRRRRLKKLEEIIRQRYPEDSQGAIEWRAKNDDGKYPCALPDPADKYTGYSDMM